MNSIRQKNDFTIPINLIYKAALAGIFCLTCFCGRSPSVEWRTAVVEKGDLNVEVTASGTANPHALVQVGTQVSGTIARILVDFNSRVEKGQLVALLDTTFLHAALEDAKASLRRAQAQENLIRENAKRTKDLFDRGLAAQADLDQTVADFESAKATTSSAQSALERAQINLAYAFIKSPINGVVVNRNVDVGQTVAASFSTPTLFTIADDLSKMQLQASIDEADIGQMKIGQIAHFSVDAYPDRQFSGTVTQIRLQPTTVQNVVTYTVVIDVENPDLSIMPGMTANITLTVQQAHDVLKVPQAALKFTPADQKTTTGKPWETASPSSPMPSAVSAAPAADTGLGKRAPGASGWSGNRADGNQTRHQGWSRTDSASRQMRSPDSVKTLRQKKQNRIFILDNGKPKRVPVKVGLSNGGYVAVEGDLSPGQLVIVGTVTRKNTTQGNQQSPLGGGGAPGGMPRRM
jgi:HlyD family secretion protein